MALPYNDLPAPPPELNGTGALVRLIDGMGFRYRWATEDLPEATLGFRPCEGAMTLGEVLAHMYHLVRWVDASLRAGLDGDMEPVLPEAAEAPTTLSELRSDTLATLVALRALLAETAPSRLEGVTITGHPKLGPRSFWHFINGPLADFLTHVGQVTSWRRMAGEPGPRANVFLGQPPRQ